MLELTERDLLILNNIARYGGIYVSDVKENIFKSVQRHRDTLVTLFFLLKLEGIKQLGKNY